MSKPPHMIERKRTPAPANDDTAVSPLRKPLPISQRLPGMTDFQLTAYQASASRLIADPKHPKHADAAIALPLIQNEILRRTRSRDGVSPPTENPK